MNATQTFDQLLDAVEHLTPEDQAELIALIQRRLAERGRRQIIDDVREAEAEFARGECNPCTVDELMRDLEA